jgi:PilZ domain-containing protein
MSESPRPLERRRAERVPMPERGGPVSVVGARLLDVSPYGMMIESPVALTQDAVLKFRLAVDGRKADVSARVAACAPRPGARHAYGVGLEFLDLDPQVRDGIREALARYASKGAPS